MTIFYSPLVEEGDEVGIVLPHERCPPLLRSGNRGIRFDSPLITFDQSLAVGGLDRGGLLASFCFWDVDC
jgi:hypothetical protein